MLTNHRPHRRVNRTEIPMLFTQYYLDCLSQASYLVGD